MTEASKKKAMAAENLDRLRKERDEHEKETAQASLEAGEINGHEWTEVAQYVAVKECAEAADAARSWEQVDLPDGAWDGFPENGEPLAYTEGFGQAVAEIYAEVEKG